MSALTGWVYYNPGTKEHPHWIPGFVLGDSFYTISSVESEGQYLDYPTKTDKLRYTFKKDAFRREV